MDAHWMQIFLGLPPCEAHPCSSSSPLSRPAGQDDAADGEEEARFEFLCPYCYSEFDIGPLCSHLDEEHCFESKPVVCPVCVARVNSDLVDHITLQHGNLFKISFLRKFSFVLSRSVVYFILVLPPIICHAVSLTRFYLQHMNRRRRLKKAPSSTSDACSAALSLDRFISNLLCDLPIPDDEKQLESLAADQEAIQKSLTTQQNSKREVPTESKNSEKKEGAELRVKFVQQMILSTVFRDY